MFSLISPIGAVAHQEYVGTITARTTSVSDEGYAEAVTHDRNSTMAAQRGNCLAPKSA